MREVGDEEEKEKIRDSVKYGYSKDVMSLNILMEKGLGKYEELNARLESNLGKRNENAKELRENI